MNNTSMFKILWAKRPAKFFLILSVSALFCLFSCNKASLLGLDVQPENDLIDAEYVDSLTLLTQTVKDDTLRTEGSLISTVVLLGKYQDPIFGQSSSSFYTQLRMLSNAPNFGLSPVCDSVRLSLVYFDTYGKKIRHQQTLSVYELSESLDITAPYYSNQVKTKSSTDLANNYVFNPRPNDSVIVNKIKQPPQLRAKLATSFGQKILNLDSASRSTNENFIKAIKGLYITTENTPGLPPGEGNIMRLFIDYSSVNIYYTYKRPLKADTTGQFDLTMSGVARFMHFDHPYLAGGNPDPDLLKQLSASSPVQNDIGYVQAMSGVKTRVKMPSLVKWGQKDFIGINRAELVIKSMVPRKDTFALPSKLLLYGISDDGVSSYILPDEFEGQNYFGGSMDTTDLTSNYPTYHFTITRYIQQLISEKRVNNGLFITTSGASSTPYRIVFGGGTATLVGGGENKYQMKLRITYTKLK
jgi:hypothetical protein